MKPWNAWLAHLGLAGMCLMWVGCGGSDIPDPDSDAHAAKGAAPPAASSPPPAVAKTVTPAPEATAKPAPAEPAAKPEPAPTGAVAKTEPVPTPAEPKEVESDSGPEPKTETPSATTEMLALGNGPRLPAGSDSARAGSGPSSSSGSSELAASSNIPSPGRSGSPPPASSGSPPNSSGSSSSSNPGAFPMSSGSGSSPGPNNTAIAPPGSSASGSDPARNVTPATPPDVNGAQANQAPGVPDNGRQNALGGGADGQQQNLPSANFHDPYSATVAFLTALKTKDLDQLAEATALHAPTEAKGKNQKLFAAILDQSLSDDDLEELVKRMDGYRIVGQNTPHSSGRIGIILMKPEGTSQMIRTVTVRHEKKGWKVVDISGKRELEKPIVIPRMPGFGMPGRRR